MGLPSLPTYVLLTLGQKVVQFHKPRSQASLIFCLSVCIWYTRSTQKWKSNKKWERLVHYVNDVRWTRDGHRVERPQLQKQHTGKRSTAVLDFRC